MKMLIVTLFTFQNNNFRKSGWNIECFEYLVKIH